MNIRHKFQVLIKPKKIKNPSKYYYFFRYPPMVDGKGHAKDKLHDQWCGQTNHVSLQKTLFFSTSIYRRSLKTIDNSINY